MNEKKFFDVFQDFNCPDNLYSLLEQIVITDVILSKSKKLLSVYMRSSILIDKKDIYNIERLLSDFIFQNKMKVKLIEKYELSDQYNISKLAEIYKESLLFEMDKEQIVLYRLVKDSEWYINDNIITLTLDDNFLAKTRSVELKAYLEKLFNERFGYEVQIGFDFTEEQKDMLRKANEHRFELEVNRILDNVEKNENKDSEENTAEQEVPKSDQKDTQKDSKKAAEKALNKQDDEKSQNSKGNSSFSGIKENRWKRQQYAKNNAKDPDVIYGKNVEGNEIKIADIESGIGEVVVRGEIFSLKKTETDKLPDKYIITFSISDFTDSIFGKIFIKKTEWDLLEEDFKVGGFYKVKGYPMPDKYSNEVTISNISGIKPIPDFTTKRMDNSLDKRVELHMHTKFSDNDSVVDVKKIISYAKAWGHPALAITDHGMLQAFPVADHEIKKDDNLKIIYGVEGYFVDDSKVLVSNSKGQTLDDVYVIFDVETTGPNPKFSKIIEICGIKIKNGEVTDRFSEFVNPRIPIPYATTQRTTITDNMVVDKPGIEEILPRFLDFAKDSVLVSHNASFYMGFIEKNARDMEMPCDYTVLDTMSLAMQFCPEIGKFSLERVCKHLGIKMENHRTAGDTVPILEKIFRYFVDVLKNKGIGNLDELNLSSMASDDRVKNLRRYHGIILAKNEVGRVNLNRLVSESHVRFYNKKPLMPKSLISKYREGLILGSACEAGELFQALEDDAPDDEIDRIVRFYDYLEIQPIGNNEFLKRSDSYPNINTDEDLQEFNKRIVKLGELYNKPVVATCDVHFLDPEDSIYRAILQASRGYKDADTQPPLFFRTTDEMLAEFQYLGSEKAREVVIDNTVMIANMIERIHPTSPDKCPPVIENSDITLRQICYDKAHEIYGPDLPEQVTSRLEVELQSIISNGYAVLYIIAQKLVWDSNDHGYMVGSRGSVGSSFVATMAGISEVNPLPAHYICPECHYVDFDSEVVKNHSGNSGCDLPDKNCPNCGKLLKKEGHDIPFETFLGFNGDKEPDIDLNFSGEYQALAHAYTEKLFGKGKAFRAGTIGTIADKTAEQLVYKYYEERGVTKNGAELSRIAKGCEGVKRTTGQHPGGIVVVPRDRDINEFTAIQKPAYKVDTDIITTHFEYHSIDSNLLKLDILGHDDPSMIRRLEDLTGVKVDDIPLDDAEVMSLYLTPDALGITSEDIDGAITGSLALPEFGTSFAMDLLVDAKPKNFSDLVRVAGLSHGTGVWQDNAQTLIAEGKTELSGAICCRDDIMVYLIHMGLEPGTAFKIMENVRKGNVAKGKCDKWPEWEEEMISHGVPDWYIWSCKQIQYMFPKAHAAAYVMMSWRIGYYKLRYPLEFYASFFSIRAKKFNYDTMCRGKERVLFEIKEIRRQAGGRKLTENEKETIRDMRIVLEMYARGFEFLPMDIYRADDADFTIIDGKIMPALCSIPGIADNASSMIKEAVRKLRESDPEATFMSKDDLKEASGVGKSAIEKMSELGILDGMPDSNQLSLFDL